MSVLTSSRNKVEEDDGEPEVPPLPSVHSLTIRLPRRTELHPSGTSGVRHVVTSTMSLCSDSEKGGEVRKRARAETTTVYDSRPTKAPALHQEKPPRTI